MAKFIEFNGTETDIIWVNSNEEGIRKGIVKIPAGYDAFIVDGNDKLLIQGNNEAKEHKFKDNVDAVYYVKNSLHELRIKWGTPSRVSVRSAHDGESVLLGGFGYADVKLQSAQSSLKLINKYLGRKKFYSEEDLYESLRGLIVEQVTFALGDLSSIDDGNLVKVQKELTEKSNVLLEKELDKIGFTLNNLVIENINSDR